MALDFKNVNLDQRKIIVPQSTLVKRFLNFLNSLKNITTISSREKQFFVQNLQVMIKSGLALDKSLKTLAEQTKNKRFKNIIFDLYQNTEKGVSFKESLGKYQSTFGELFVNMVEAGEISGRLDDVLGQIYLQIKKSNELRSRIKAAMTYPVIVVVAMILIGIGMLIFVIPKITSLFDQMNAKLPFATRLLINISKFVVNNGVLTALVTIAIIVVFVLILRSAKGKYIFHGIVLKLPVFGPIIQEINLAKFARTLSSLIKTDIPIIKTFEVTAQVLGNKHYQRVLIDAAKKLKKGTTIADSLREYSNLFPPVIIQMISTGEETGKVDEILAELASFYEDEIDRIMKTLPSIIEPLLMIILGAGVAVMAIAIIMPMYSLTQQF